MGQKTIPTSLRLEIFKNWESHWISDSQEYSNFVYFDYTIRNYLCTIVNSHNLTLKNINIKKQANSLQIFLFCHNQKTIKPCLNIVQLKQNKNQIEQNIKKFSSKLLQNYSIKLYIVNVNMLLLKKNYIFYQIIKYYRKKIFFKKIQKFLSIYTIIIHTQSVKLFNQIIKQNLIKTPKHLQYLKTVYGILLKLFNKYPNFKGFKIQYKGRLNGRERSSTVCYQAGPITLNTLKNNVHYDYQEIMTPSGVCSLKTWFLFSSN